MHNLQIRQVFAFFVLRSGWRKDNVGTKDKYAIQVFIPYNR